MYLDIQGPQRHIFIILLIFSAEKKVNNCLVIVKTFFFFQQSTDITWTHHFKASYSPQLHAGTWRQQRALRSCDLLGSSRVRHRLVFHWIHTATRGTAASRDSLLVFITKLFFFFYSKSAVNPSWSICGVIGCAAVHHHRPHPTTTTSTNTAAGPVCEPHSLLLICSCSPVSGVVFVFIWRASAFIVLFKQLAAAFLWLSFNRKEHSSSYVLRRSVPLVFYYGRRPGSRQGLGKAQTRDNMFDMRGIPFVLLDIVCLVLGMYLNAFFPSSLLCTMLLVFLM